MNAVEDILTRKRIMRVISRREYRGNLAQILGCPPAKKKPWRVEIPPVPCPDGFSQPESDGYETMLQGEPLRDGVVIEVKWPDCTRTIETIEVIERYPGENEDGSIENVACLTRSVEGVTFRRELTESEPALLCRRLNLKQNANDLR